MKDQAETLRLLMRDRQSVKKQEAAIAVYLSPEAKRRRLFSPRELALRNREMGGNFRIRDVSDALAAVGGSPVIEGHLSVLTGDEADIVACTQRIKIQAKTEGVKKMDVIVCGVDGDQDGRRIFAKLFEGCRRLFDQEPDVDLHYVGTISMSEKISESVAISNFLLHYQSRAGSLIGRK